jgi:flagellar assembly factor FliW
MPRFDTKNFGTITYEPNSIVEFPNGLPGFDQRRQFVALTYPHTEPLVFLQSLEDAGLCFVTLPARSIDQQYRLEVSKEDLKTIGLEPERQPLIGDDVACVAILTFQESGTTANLLAPVVINTKNLKAVQAISPELSYSHQHPLAVPEAMACS